LRPPVLFNCKQGIGTQARLYQNRTGIKLRQKKNKDVVQIYVYFKI